MFFLSFFQLLLPASTAGLGPLDLHGSAAQVGENWCRWRRAFTYYVEGKGIEAPARLKTLLLHHAGMTVQDLFEDLTDPAPDTEDDNPYKKALWMLDKHFDCPPNTPYERHQFWQLTFRGGETCNQFVVRLRRQVRYCAFEDATDDNIRDQLINRLPNVELKRNMLQERNVTLTKALELARAWEAAGEQACAMSTDSRTATGAPSINVVKSSRRPKPKPSNTESSPRSG